MSCWALQERGCSGSCVLKRSLQHRASRTHPAAAAPAFPVPLAEGLCFTCPGSRHTGLSSQPLNYGIPDWFELAP